MDSYFKSNFQKQSSKDFLSTASFQNQSQQAQNSAADEEVERSIGISLASVGLFGFVVFLVLYNLRLIKLNQGQIGVKNAFLVGAAILSLTCYQSLNIFYYAGQQKFLPYSAIFLNMNFLILSVVFFIQKIQRSLDIEDFLVKYFPEKGQKEVDRKREGALINEIESQKKDEAWKCNFSDLSDVITPIQVCRSDFEDFYFSKIKKFRLLTVLKIVLILASFLLLTFYAFILYQVDNGNILGIIIAISVTCLDLFNILRAYNQKSHKNTVVYLMLNRFLLVCLGESQWIYGCMIVYLIYGSDLVLQIAQRRFPFDQDILDEEGKGIYPSILFLILSVMYCSLLYVVQYVNWPGKNIQKLIFNPGPNQSELGVGLGSVITVAMMLTVYLFACILRMYIRKAQKTVKASGYDFFNKRFTIKNRLCSILNIFILLVYICFVGLFSIFYALSKDISLIIWGVFLPVIIIAYSYGFTYFCLNEYHYLQDVTKLNKTIDAHNIKIGQLEKRKQILSQQIADGTLFVDDDSAAVAKLDISQKLSLKNNRAEDLAKFKDLVKDLYKKKKTQHEQLIKNEEGREQDLEASKVYIDIDEAEQEGDGLRRMAENRHMRVKDWRKESNLISALFSGKLRPNDKGFIYSMAIALIAWFGLFIGLTSTKAAFKGTAIALLYLGVSLIISSAVVQQSRALTVKEFIPWIVFNLIYVSSSLIYFFLSFDGIKSSPEGLRYIFYYILTLPTIIHGIILLIRVFTNGFEGLIVEFKLFIAIFLLGKFSMIIMGFFINPVSGGIYFCLVVLIGSAIRIGFVYRQNGELTRFQTIGSLVLAAIIVFIPILIAICDKSYTMFQGFSASGLLFFLVICIYSVGSWIQDLREKDLRPIYCSRFIFPIYKFDVIKKDFVPHNSPTISWFLGLMILLLLSFFISFVIETIWEGAFLSILIETVILLSAMFFSSTTFGLINDVNILMNETICKQSWLQVKKIFFKENGIFSSGSRDSYRRLWKHQFFLNGYQKILNGSQPDPINSIINKELAEEIQKEQVSGTNLKDFYQKKIRDIFPDLEGQIENKQNIDKFLFELQDRLKATYQKEIILLIRFLIIALQNFKSAEETDQKTFLRFLNEKADVFQVFGIKIIVSKHLSINSQYKQAKQQIQDLEADKKKRFDDIEEATKLEKQREAEKAGKTRADDKQRHEERQKELEENVKQKEEALKVFEATSGSDNNLDVSLDPNTLPDCLKKYQLIVARAQKNKTKFVDAQFPAVDSSIGPEVIQNLGRGTRTWITASEHKHESGQPYTIFQDGVDFSDIEQGSLGDCYYLSALAVLGSEHTKQRFVFINNEEEWKMCGAFCLKFYFDGQESIVIIDDKFLTVNDEFPFVKTPSRVEMWPMILEKAYAKFYGSYQNIEGGFVHKALQELISGIPVLLANEKQTDKNQFYEKLKLYQSQGFPMGAGSPAHQDGDKAISAMGIVQGHAFSVIKVAQVDNTKLICIRNPWGQGEWTGDWSDNCSKWTERAKNLAGYTESKDDGVFWMDFNDYLKEFDEIYVCMTLTTNLGWNCLDLADKWEGKYGQGVPSGNNRSAKLVDSPQFSLTVNKPGKAHIVFRVKEKIDSNNPAVYPYLNVQDNEGELISRPNSTKELATLGPTNLIVQTAEIEFKAGLKYPRTITILASFIANDDHPTDEKNFSLKVYSTDDQAKLKKIN